MKNIKVGEGAFYLQGRESLFNEHIFIDFSREPTPGELQKKKHDEDVGPPSFHLILQGATPTCVHPTGHVFGWTWEFGGRVQARDFVSLEF